MSYQFNLSEKKEYLRVEISGTRIHGKEVKNFLCILEKLAEICREKKQFRVLIVSKLSGFLPNMAAFNISTSLTKIGWKRIWRLAYVIEPNGESQEAVHFAETVAVNRGFRLTKIFDCEEEARIWLLGSGAVW